MRLHVEVTQDDIDKGVRHTPNACMVAYAFGRATEGAWSTCLVAPRWDYAKDQYEWVIETEDFVAPLTNEVGRKIAKWDAKLPVEPFAFDLDLPIEEDR